MIVKNKYFFCIFKVKNCIFRLQTYKRYVKSMATVATQLLLPPKVCMKEFFYRKEQKTVKKHCKITLFHYSLLL